MSAQLQQAIINAHNAGDVAAAQRLGQLLKQQKQVAPQQMSSPSAVAPHRRNQSKETDGALAFSVDQAQKMVNLTEEAVSLSGQLAGQPGFDELIGSEGISDLTKMNNALKSMGAILVNALGPALNVILVLLNGVFSLVDVFMESTGINTLLRLAGGQGLSYLRRGGGPSGDLADGDAEPEASSGPRRVTRRGDSGAQ